MTRLLTSLKRVIRSGYLNFSRNKTVSMSSLAILTVTLVIIGLFFFARGIFNFSLGQIQDKVDVKIYFKPNVKDLDIASVSEKMKSLPEVETVNLTTAEQALQDFQVAHSDDAITLQALQEVGVNPFGAMLTVVAKDTNSYESIATILNTGGDFFGDSYGSIEKINYFEVKPTIDKLNTIIKWTNAIGFWTGLIFIIISAMIIYNTIRLSIFIFKEEISVMKLVGASNMYIRGPFIVESSIYAVVSTLIALILFLPITYWISKRTTVFFNGLDLHSYYLNHFFELFLLLLVVSLFLSAISSLIAMRRYLKV